MNSIGWTVLQLLSVVLRLGFYTFYSFSSADKMKLTYVYLCCVDLLHAFVEYANAVVASAAKNVNLYSCYLTPHCSESAAKMLIGVTVVNAGV